MNNNINEFMKKTEPKFKLKKYEDEILFLIKEGYTHEQVLQYLKEFYGVEVTRRTLSSQLKHMKKTVRTVPKSKSESDNKSSKPKVSKEEFLAKMKGG